MHLLDLLRFGAAAAVVLYHFTATPTATRYWGADVTALFAGLNEVTRYGWLAVEAFFVVSGFAILWSTQGRSLAQYVGSRVGRLYPAFWACIAVTALLQAFWTGGRELGLGDTLLNLTMAPDVFGAELSQVVYWTLLVELTFYVLVGVLLAFGPLTRAKVLGLALGWPAAGILAHALGYPVLAEHLVVRHSVYLGIGMLLFLLWQDVTARSAPDAAAAAGAPATTAAPGRPGRRGTAVVGASLAALLALAVVRVTTSAQQASELQGVPVSPGVAVTVLLTVVATVWVATRPWAAVRDPRLGALCVLAGALTYPLYLVHTQFGWAVTEWLSRAGVGRWATLAAAVGVSVLLAVLIHHAVERPFSTRLRRAVTRALPSVPALVALRSGAQGAPAARNEPEPYGPVRAAARELARPASLR